MLTLDRVSNAVAVVRRVALAMAVLCVVAIVYISLRPFVFTEAPWDDTVAEFVEFTFRRPIRILDVARNVIAIVPFGFFLAAASAPEARREGALGRGLRIVAGVALLSASLEVAQAFVRVRIVSGRDVAAQAIGAAAGVVVWTCAGRRVVKSIERLMTAEADRDQRRR